MNGLEKTKLQLLTHSKNMLLLAQQHEWERFSELEQNWMTLLQSSHAQYGSALNCIGSALLDDNQQIQHYVKVEQKMLMEALACETKNTSSLKSYLK